MTLDMQILLDIFPIVLFFISFFGLTTSENIIKSIILTMLMQTSVIMFWLVVGSRHGVRPPIIYDTALLYNLEQISDPLPQALMLTAIIIGISVTAINITMLNSLYRKYHTAEWKPMSSLAKANENKD
jgi:multicomponent Na+:H+ antiporter subunit C